MSLRTVDRLAREQHGVLTREQALGCGIPGSTVKRWLRAGRLVSVFAGVYRLAGAPATWEQRLLAAVLGGGNGAAASHRSAARLWGLLDDEMVEISVHRGRLPRLHGVIVHRSSDLAPAYVVVRTGIPTTAPARTLVDLGAVVRPYIVEDALDRALVRRLTTVPGVERELGTVARRGRSGAGVLRAVLDERALGAERPDGLLEPRMARLLRDHGLPTPAFQHDVRQGDRFVARVDFAFPELRVAIEVDGFEAHSSPRAMNADLERQNRLVALGWTVVRFTWEQVVRRPETVAADIRCVLGTVRSA